MLRRLLARATVSAASSLPLRRVPNHVLPVLNAANLPSTAGSGSPDIASSKTHPASSSILYLGTKLKFSAYSTQTASISGGVSANEDDDPSAGEGGNGCVEAKGFSLKEIAKCKHLSSTDVAFLDAALPPKGPAKPGDMSLEVVEKLVGCFRKGSQSDLADITQMLENRGVRLSRRLIALVLSRLWKNCDAALAFFLWAKKQPDNQLTFKEFHSMVVILVKGQRFDAALSLIRETTRSKPSLVRPQTALFLLKSYCAMGQEETAIATFDTLVDLGFQVGAFEFEALLSFLCSYGKVAKADKLLLREEKRFPFCIKNFNVVLKGWCEVLVHPLKAKQLWQTMADVGLQRDVDSYGMMISCLTTAGDMDGAMRLFDEMKDLGMDPDIKVYKGVLVAMASANLIEEAMELMRKMKEEKGVFPGATTFGFMFWGACRCGNADGAAKLLDMMTKSGVRMTLRSFSLLPNKKSLNGIFDNLRTGKDVMTVLGALKQARYDLLPGETYNMLIRKLCKLREYDVLSTVWARMCLQGPKPDGRTYVSMIYGLFSKQKMEEAYRYYQEMRGKCFHLETRTHLGFLVKKVYRP